MRRLRRLYRRWRRSDDDMTDVEFWLRALRINDRFGIVWSAFIGVATTLLVASIVRGRPGWLLLADVIFGAWMLGYTMGKRRWIRDRLLTAGLVQQLEALEFQALTRQEPR